MADILIVDDETSLVNSLGFALRAEGYAVASAGTGEAGLLAAQASPPSLVLLDLRLPDGSGLDFLDRLRAALPDVPVVMISAHGDTRAAVQAVKRGAVDYLTKPFDLDDLLVTLRAALERQRMAQEIARYRAAELARGEMVGESPPVKSLLESVRRIGESSTSRVLLLGESGTGKALVARAIHAHGARARGPFVEVNCASLPEHLIEAELFGAEKGSYTGADQKRVGLATLADGGTLFLDEVGELPLPLQAKLLHFLEDGSYRPIGSVRSLTADCRVIAATNRDLAAEVRAGAFREDLFYRLNVVQLLPARAPGTGRRRAPARPALRGALRAGRAVRSGPLHAGGGGDPAPAPLARKRARAPQPGGAAHHPRTRPLGRARRPAPGDAGRSGPGGRGGTVHRGGTRRDRAATRREGAAGGRRAPGSRRRDPGHLPPRVEAAPAASRDA